MSFKEKEATIIDGINMYGDLSIEVIDKISNSSATAQEKTEMLIALKQMFDLGLSLIGGFK